MQQILTATAPAAADDPDQRDYRFVSVDGWSWLEVETDTWPPTPASYRAIARLFKWRITFVDGKARRSGSLQMTTRYLNANVDGIIYHSPIRCEAA